MPDRVEFDISEVPAGSTLLHCHTNATPLSSEDLKLLTNPNIDSIMNIAGNGDAYLVNTRGYHPDKDEFIDVELNIRRDVNAEIAVKALDEGWTPDEATYMAIKEELFRLCRYFGWQMFGGRLE